MDEIYKRYRIIISASQVASSRQWKQQLTIIWSEDGEGVVRKFLLDREFNFQVEAENEGLRFAQEWIAQDERASHNRILRSVWLRAEGVASR